MDQGSLSSASISFEARAAGRLSVSFFLDIAQIGRRDAPLLDALLAAAVLEANTNPLIRDPALQHAHARLDSPPPDELRRPVSVNALAASLRLPFETVRRHVKKLVAQGVCVATPQGVYVPAEVVASPQWIEMAKDRYRRVLRFHADLRAADAIEPLPFAPPPVDHPQAPVRAVGRILSDYFFRTIDALQRQVGDPLTSVVFFEVMRTTGEHIPPDQALAAMRVGWIPAGARKPARVADLSRRLAVPYETTRRHVGWLIEQGVCERVGGGVVVAAEYVERPEVLAGTAENFANVRRMFRQFAALDLASDDQGAEAAAL